MCSCGAFIGLDMTMDDVSACALYLYLLVASGCASGLTIRFAVTRTTGRGLIKLNKYWTAHVGMLQTESVRYE
jgi:hypothetical protein